MLFLTCSWFGFRELARHLPPPPGAGRAAADSQRSCQPACAHPTDLARWSAWLLYPFRVSYPGCCVCPQTAQKSYLQHRTLKLFNKTVVVLFLFRYCKVWDGEGSRIYTEWNLASQALCFFNRCIAFSEFETVTDIYWLSLHGLVFEVFWNACFNWIRSTFQIQMDLK